MNSFMTSLSKNVKPDFILNPMDLLETKQSVFFDGREIISFLRHIGNTLFQCTENGVYLPWTSKALFTSHEELYTHKDTYEFFPEISSPVVRTINEVISAQLRGAGVRQINVRETVGQRINWRDAINEQVNVYNREGRLLLRATDDRSRMGLLFNPGPGIHANQFFVDMVEYAVLEATAWGDPSQVLMKIDEYILDGVCSESAVKHYIEQHHCFFQQLINWVSQDPWLIYKVNSLGSNVIVDSSCDYRHFKCNEMLLNQLKEADPTNDVLQAWAPAETSYGPIRYEDLGKLYQALFDATGFKISTLPEFFRFLEQTKGHRQLTLSVLNVIDKFLSDNKNNPCVAREFVGRLTSKGEIQLPVERTNGIQNPGFNDGLRVYIL